MPKKKNKGWEVADLGHQQGQSQVQMLRGAQRAHKDSHQAQPPPLWHATHGIDEDLQQGLSTNALRSTCV